MEEVEARERVAEVSGSTGTLVAWMVALLVLALPEAFGAVFVEFSELVMVPVEDSKWNEERPWLRWGRLRILRDAVEYTLMSGVLVAILCFAGLGAGLRDLGRHIQWRKLLPILDEGAGEPPLLRPLRAHLRISVATIAVSAGVFGLSAWSVLQLADAVFR